MLRGIMSRASAVVVSLLLVVSLPFAVAILCAPSEEEVNGSCVQRTQTSNCDGFIISAGVFERKVRMTDPDTRTSMCCEPTQKYVIDKANSPKGECCPQGHSYYYSKVGGKGKCCPGGHYFSFHEATANGECCPKEYIWNGNVCDPPTVPSPPTPPAPQPLPVQPSWCQLRKVCPKNCNDIGLKYGHCYIITYPDGRGFYRHISNEYLKGATYYGEIPFRVCTVEKDCKATETTLTRKDGFLLRDEKGAVAKYPADNKGWVFTNSIGSPFLYRSDAEIGSFGVAGKTPMGIVPFVGKPSCMNDGCSICLNTQIEGGAGLGAVGAAIDLLAIGATMNINRCQVLIFHEIKCDDAECAAT